MCYGSESVKLGYDSSITPGQGKMRKKERKGETKPERGELWDLSERNHGNSSHGNQ